MTDNEIIKGLECCGNMECNDDCPLFCQNGCQKYLMTKTIDLIKRQQVEIERYKDLEEQGRLIELPCKVGDTVWEVDTEQYYYDEFMITDITITHHGIGFENPYMGLGFNLEDFGKTIFLTKEEAEVKLKEMKGE